MTALVTTAYEGAVQATSRLADLYHLSDPVHSPPASVSSEAGDDSSSSVHSEGHSLSIASHVYLPRARIGPSLLASSFANCASDGLLGLYTGSSEACTPAIVGFSWRKEEFFVEGATVEILCSERSIDIHDVVEDTSNAAEPDMLRFISAASLRCLFSTRIGADLDLYILERPAVAFLPMSTTPTFVPLSHDAKASNAAGNVPTREEWQNLWRVWDLVTLGMIPKEMLHQKPVDLRHKCLFYTGHIPTFLDMLLCKAIGGTACEPQYFWNIFERGIDPHVDNPDHCHKHSEVPDKDEDWPDIETIIAFRNSVRSKLFQLYDELDAGKRVLSRNIVRTLVMTLEHEGFHVETLLYMLIQRAGTGTLPPAGFTVPPWTLLASQWDATPPPSSETVTIEATSLTIGHDDSEGDDTCMEHDINHIYGWDNESPARTVDVAAFKADWRCVTNKEFEQFWRGAGKGRVPMPKSWVEEHGEIKVRTLYGPVPMNIAQHWPVLTSYDSLKVYAQFKGGRLPTEPELRLFLDKYEAGYENGGNTGFRNWHPIASTMGLEQNGGKGSNGGVWEWTSTAFDAHDGLVPTNLFVGYSTDFFDTVHHVVLGSSYATLPRLERRTLRNFYQHNYPYPWASARVVYDLKFPLERAYD